MTVTLQTLTLQIFVGAYLMTLPRIGRKGSMLIGFGGYLVIGLVRRTLPRSSPHRLRA